MTEKEFEKSLENSVVISLEKYNELLEAKITLDIFVNAVLKDNNELGLGLDTQKLIKSIIKES